MKSPLKLKLLIFFSLFSLSGKAQISWVENFNDTNLNQPVKWLGDTSAFTVNQAHELQLNAANLSSPRSMSCRSEVVNQASWEIDIRLQFSPSASNYAEVYLLSDQIDPRLATKAIFLRIGGISGNADDVSLFLKDENSIIELIDGVDGLAGGAQVDLRIKVEKDSSHLWKLWADENRSGTFLYQGSAFDSTIEESSYFGLIAYFTSTRSDKFFWDSIRVSGKAFVDLEPIRITSIGVIDSLTLELNCAEIPQRASALNANHYQLLGTGHLPNLIQFNDSDSSILRISFAQAFQSGVGETLIVKGLKDRFGNTMQADSIGFTFYQLADAYFGDLRINEVMADPSPSVGLPEAEYLEIFNTTKQYYDLEGWSIADPSSMALLPGHLIEPGAHLLLCDAEDSALFAAFDQVVGLDDFPSLNNGEELLLLRDQNGRLIDRIHYTSSWYKDPMKSSGGWSLEMINPYLSCSDEENYQASNASLGGSPASQNSLYDDQPDLIPPRVLKAEILNASLVKLSFSEAIDSTLFDQSLIYLNGVRIDTLASLIEEAKGLAIQLKKPLDSGKFYSLLLDNLADCEGNISDSISLSLVLHERLQTGDVVLNEILFNPKPGGIDFIELYNRSGKILAVSDLCISNQADSLSTHCIKSDQRVFMPSEILVLCEEELLLRQYHPAALPDRIIEVDLPSFPNQAGAFYLRNRVGDLIDRFHYREDMHFELLSSTDGVSLERLSVFQGSWPDNFFSAAEQNGFATPTLPNSQGTAEAAEGKIALKAQTFSPDHDGYQDLLFLDYELPSSGFVGTIEILDDQGRLIYQLVNNQLLSDQGSFRWDGLDKSGRKVPVGMYLMTFQAFHPSGKVIFKKLPLVVAARLN